MFDVVPGVCGLYRARRKAQRIKGAIPRIKSDTIACRDFRGE